jgi:hypothetical protein
VRELAVHQFDAHGVAACVAPLESLRVVAAFVPQAARQRQDLRQALATLQPGMQHHRVVDVAHWRVASLAQRAQRAAELQQQPEHDQRDGQRDAGPTPLQVAQRQRACGEQPADDRVHCVSQCAGRSA